jgi:uncharacterized membrane protein
MANTSLRSLLRENAVSDLQIAAWLMVVFCGIWTGGINVIAVDRLSVWNRMSIQEYAVDFRRLLFRVDPMMPILAIVTLISAVYFAMYTNPLASKAAWIGAGLVLLVIIASVSLAEPVNSKFRRVPEGTVPEGADRYRVFWRRFHMCRNVAAIIAFACLAAAAVEA